MRAVQEVISKLAWTWIDYVRSLSAEQLNQLIAIYLAVGIVWLLIVVHLAIKFNHTRNGYEA